MLNIDNTQIKSVPKLCPSRSNIFKKTNETKNTMKNIQKINVLKKFKILILSL